MSTKVFVIHLAGQGDVEIKVVDQAIWDWVNDGGKCPQSVKDEFRAQRVGPFYTAEEVEAEILELDDIHEGSSPDNDRALSAPQARYNGEIFEGSTIKELNKFLKKHDLEIEEEYEGYIY